MPGIDYHQLRRQITMAEVLDLIGFQPTWRHGPQLRGPCPIPGCGSASCRSLLRPSCPAGLSLLRLPFPTATPWISGRPPAAFLFTTPRWHLCQATDLDPPWLASHCHLSLASRSVASRAPLRNR